MPERVYSALNTGGTSVVTDPERFGAQFYAQMQDNAVRQAMLAEQARQFNANFGDRSNERAFQAGIQGTFAQRNQGQLDLARQYGQNELGVAGLQSEAARSDADLRSREYGDLGPLREAQMSNAIADAKTQGQFRTLLQQEFERQYGGSAPAAPGGPSLPGGAAPTGPAAPASGGPDYSALVGHGSGVQATAGSNGGAGMGAGLQMDPTQKLSFLLAAANHQTPADPYKQSAERELLGLDIARRKREDAQSRADAYAQSGNFDMARQIGRESGVAIQQQNPDDVVKRYPDVAEAITKVATNVKNYVNNPSAGDDFDLDGMINDAAKVMSSRGVEPTQASAYIRNLLNQIVPQRSIGLGRGLSLAADALPFGVFRSGSGQPQRVDTLRGQLGY